MTYYTPPEVRKEVEEHSYYDIVLCNPPWREVLAAPTAPGKTLPARVLMRKLIEAFCGMVEMQP